MKAASDFENGLRKAFAQSMKDGVPPILAIGIMEGVKHDIMTNLRESAAAARAEATRSQIVRSTTLPAQPVNGHS